MRSFYQSIENVATESQQLRRVANVRQTIHDLGGSLLLNINPSFLDLVPLCGTVNH